MADMHIKTCTLCGNTGAVGDRYCNCPAAIALRTRIESNPRRKEIDAKLEQLMAAADCSEITIHPAVDHGPSKLAPFGWCGAGHEVAPALRADGSCPLCPLSGVTS